MNKILTIPNAICILRIIVLPFLYYLLFTGHTTAFLILLTLFGLTDAIDGFIARKLNQVTKLGAILDSIADYLYYFSFAMWFFATQKEIFVHWKLLLVPIIIVAIAYLIIAIRFKTFVLLHLYSSKLTAAIAYAFIAFTAIKGFNETFFKILILFWTLTTIEILMFSIKTKTAQFDLKSVIIK